MQVEVARVPRPNVAQTVQVPDGSTVAAALAAVGAMPDSVIVIRGERPVPLDARLADGDRLRVINVFSGG